MLFLPLVLPVCFFVVNSLYSAFNVMFEQHLKEKEKRGDMLIQRHCIVPAVYSVLTTVTLQVLQTSLMKRLSI